MKREHNYLVCYSREDIKYYDKELDKVLIRKGYNYCESYPLELVTNNQGLTGSCIDTGCIFHNDPMMEDELRYKEVGKKYFIRY